jgi:ribosomal protein L24
MKEGNLVRIISGNMSGKIGIVYNVNGDEGYENGKKYTLIAVMIDSRVYHFRPDEIVII